MNAAPSEIENDLEVQVDRCANVNLPEVGLERVRRVVVVQEKTWKNEASSDVCCRSACALNGVSTPCADWNREDFEFSGSVKPSDQSNEDFWVDVEHNLQRNLEVKRVKVGLQEDAGIDSKLVRTISKWNSCAEREVRTFLDRKDEVELSCGFKVSGEETVATENGRVQVLKIR